MNKTFITILNILLFCFSNNAQNEIDALRYSHQNLLGSARFSGMGGAYGALGADFTSASSNPAGIGFYQFNELSITPSINNIIITSFYKGESNIDEKFGANFSNLGYIISSPQDNSEWKRLNLGFGWNRTSNYNQRTYINGLNNNSSMIDNFLANAQGNTVENLNKFTDLLAWQAFLFGDRDDMTDDGNYASIFNQDFIKSQDKVISSNGSSGEYVFTLATSYEEKVYLGVTVGIPTIDYYERSTYTESDFSDTTLNLEYFDFDQELSTSGEGVNLKAGAIIRVNEWIKIGGALHSPTYYDMEDEYNTAIIAHWNDSLGKRSYSSPLGYFDYELRTPWKAIGSIVMSLKEYGLISMDIEMIDYSLTRLNADTYKFSGENKLIKSTYRKVKNVRIGTEIKYKPFRLRAGYGFYESPYKDNQDLNAQSFSFGLGIDRGHFICDLAYIVSEQNNEHYMYSQDLVTPAKIVSTHHNFLLTLGFRY